MREVTFVKQNTPRWQEFEETISSKTNNPDKLADLFIQLTDDLSFARTNYPESKTSSYLNSLAAKVHQSIYKNRKEKSNRFITFWIYELPNVMYESRKQLLYAFLITALSTIVGVVSSNFDEDFPRLILSDQYVNMTIENIKKGDPMAIYKDEDAFWMFVRIFINNLRVDTYTFTFGLFFSIGSAFYLVYNGIMIGAFQHFFYKYGLLFASALTIWIHGTIEIFGSMVLSGCAGIVMGNSILFPGTYARVHSFKTGAMRGLKIMMGVFVMTFVAAVLESYVTRHTELPTWVKLGIILGSFTFLIWYFILYPILLNRRNAVA